MMNWKDDETLLGIVGPTTMDDLEEFGYTIVKTDYLHWLQARIEDLLRLCNLTVSQSLDKVAVDAQRDAIRIELDMFRARCERLNELLLQSGRKPTHPYSDNCQCANCVIGRKAFYSEKELNSPLSEADKMIEIMENHK